MLTIKQFIIPPIDENTYVVSDETKEAAIIDCGCFNEHEWDAIKTYINDNGLTPTRLLNTHLHFDHCLGNRFAVRDYQLKAEACIADYDMYSDLQDQTALFLGTAFARQIDTRFTAQMAPPLKDGDIVQVGTHSFTVIATPGHTPGGICFYCEAEKVLFSGDTLFMGSIGRTDLPGGSYPALIRSLTERLITLPPDTVVHCGHGPATTIRHESEFNPYL